MSVFLRTTKGKKKVWMYDFVQEQRRLTKSGFKTKLEAQNAEAERRKNLSEPQGETSQKAMKTGTTFLEMINLRMDEIKLYRSDAHYKDNFYMAKRWVSEWGDLECSSINEKMVKNFVFSRKGTSPSTSNKELRYLKATFNFAINEGLVQTNPVKKIKFLPVDKKKSYLPSPEDVKKIMALADPDDRDYLWTIIGTLARVGEINNLMWSDVDLVNHTLTLYTRKKKNSDRTPRDIPMPTWLYEIFKRRFKSKHPNLPWVFCHRYWSSREQCWCEGPYKDRKRLMAGLCKRAEVRYFRFHALRHLGASILEKNNTPITDIQGILGHEKRTTTEIYLHSIGEGKKSAMEQFSSFWQESHH